MSRPASRAVAVVHQVEMELRLTARRGENVLAMVGIPLGVLAVAGFATSGGDIVGTILPGVLALAIVASGLVNLGIATAYERGYGVLKRLGGSPLDRTGLVAAKVGVVMAIAMAQVVALLLVAWFVFGWRPEPGATVSVASVALVALVGSAAFAGLGLIVAGTLRPEAALVVANVLFLLAMVFGGGLGAFIDLPGPLSMLSSALPSGALADAFAAALGSGTDIVRPLAILTGWAVAANAVAARVFRWD